MTPGACQTKSARTHQTERDICTKCIAPSLIKAKWDNQSQIHEQACFNKGRIIVRGNLVTRGKAQFADYIFYYRPNIPFALIEAKDNNPALRDQLKAVLAEAAAMKPSDALRRLRLAVVHKKIV